MHSYISTFDTVRFAATRRFGSRYQFRDTGNVSTVSYLVEFESEPTGKKYKERDKRKRKKWRERDRERERETGRKVQIKKEKRKRG